MIDSRDEQSAYIPKDCLPLEYGKMWARESEREVARGAGDCQASISLRPFWIKSYFFSSSDMRVRTDESMELVRLEML